jgi:hypothetical protein
VIKVIYSKKGFLDQPGDESGETRCFASLDAAKSAPLREGYVSAHIPIGEGGWVYRAPFGWKFHEKLHEKE